MSEDQCQSGLLAYLPARFQEDPATRDFLRAFEKILLGRDDGKIDKEGLKDELGLEQIIESLASYFDPTACREVFLLWLSQWVALSLRMDMKIEVRRKFIAGMTQLYRWRGTKKSMESLLKIFVEDREATIKDQLDKEEPHYFTVELDLEKVKEGDQREDFERAMQIAHSVIRLEKPAHTRYQLIPVLETMRIGKGWWQPQNEPTPYKIQVGKNTRLGKAKWKTTS